MPHEQNFSKKILFFGMGIGLTVMRLSFLAFPLFPGSGKDKKMKTPKTPAAFDYDLWTTEDGRYMVRIKATGEVTEVQRTVMQLLRTEEKRLRRGSRIPQDPDLGNSSRPTILWKTGAGICGLSGSSAGPKRSSKGRLRPLLIWRSSSTNQRFRAILNPEMNNREQIRSAAVNMERSNNPL